MSFVPVQVFQAKIASLVTPSSTTVKLSSADAATLTAALVGGNFTICTLSNGLTSEIVYVTGVTGVTATITRAQEGTVAGTYSIGSLLRFVWTSVGIQDIASGGTAGIVITGSGGSVITGGPFTFNVASPAQVNLAAGSGISLTGSYPNLTVTNTAPTSGATVVTGSGQAIISPISGGYNVAVATPSFTAGTGISVTGTYPNLTITNTAPAVGGTGTVTSVNAGTGITITGDPTVNPTIAITPTGVTPGVYGGLTINAGGQITAVSGSLITGVVSGSGAALVVSGPTAGVVTLTLANSSTAQRGVVALAVNTAIASSNPADTTSAVTPSGIAAVIAAQVPVVVSADTSNIPLASASYTNPILTSSLSLSLASGKTAVVTCVVEVTDTVTPTNIPSFGIGLFTGVTFIDGNSDNVPSALRVLVVKISGPFTGIVGIATTTLTGTFAVQSKSINIVTN